MVRCCSGRRNLQKGFLLCSKLLKKTKLLGLRIIREHTYHQQYFTGMLFHLSFFKNFSYQRCSSQNFFMRNWKVAKHESCKWFSAVKKWNGQRHHDSGGFTMSKFECPSKSRADPRGGRTTCFLLLSKPFILYANMSKFARHAHANATGLSAWLPTCQNVLHK